MTVRVECDLETLEELVDGADRARRRANRGPALGLRLARHARADELYVPAVRSQDGRRQVR